METKQPELPGTVAFQECCQRVIRAAKEAKPHNMIQYARTYAEAGLGMHDRHSIKSQALYILSNLGTWRGEEAKMVKAQLKEFANY
jgi:hypothetical protein